MIKKIGLFLASIAPGIFMALAGVIGILNLLK